MRLIEQIRPAAAQERRGGQHVHHRHRRRQRRLHVPDAGALGSQRTRSQAEITAELNRKLQAIPGIQVSAFTSNSLGIRGGGQGLQFSITGTDYDQLAGVADKLVAAMEKDPVFATARSTPTPPSRSCRSRSTASAPPMSASRSTRSRPPCRRFCSGKDLGNFYIGDDAIEILAACPTA